MTDQDILQMADFIIDNRASTRQTADYFGTSNCTVSNCMNKRLPKIDEERYRLVRDVFDGNTPKTIDDAEVIDRINKVIGLIKMGLTVVDIAKLLGESENVIYEDLETRLPRLSEEEDEIIKQFLKQNSHNNLRLGSEMSVSTQPRENGKFVSKNK